MSTGIPALGLDATLLLSTSRPDVGMLLLAPESGSGVQFDPRIFSFLKTQESSFTSNTSSPSLPNYVPLLLRKQTKILLFLHLFPTDGNKFFKSKELRCQEHQAIHQGSQSDNKDRYRPHYTCFCARNASILTSWTNTNSGGREEVAISSNGFPTWMHDSSSFLDNLWPVADLSMAVILLLFSWICILILLVKVINCTRSF
ncbi:hypothetical protein M9H77_25364 [Catharanthus roseus]|uniref:Uncharacterized protein n=1 Tax=Catharanthus roseus TaxID=4058 RepID=A0ACC0A7L2_CATRO|nr:hypothetical protein M9H77_25364 [Catharanthus roseus]